MKTAVASRQARPSRTDKNGRLSHAGKKIWRSRYLYLLLLPTFVWYIVFMYAPLYGAQIAFRDFMPALGITGGKWVGFKYFIQFFKSEYFVRLMKNTLGISVYSIVVGFPIPVILALLMNEVRSKYFKKGVQTIVYMPHFISAVVVVSLINAMLSPSNGLFNQIIQMFGGDPVHFMAEPKYFKTVYVLSDIWQTAGYGSIVYLAALTSIDPSLYEAATVDGASWWQKLTNITIPLVRPSLTVSTVLNVIYVFNSFPIIYTITKGAPANKTDTLITYLYMLAFYDQKKGPATALSVVGFLILCAVAGLYMMISLRKEDQA